MRPTPHVLPVILALGAPAAWGEGEIAADRNPIAKGEKVTLRWHFTGDKVTVSGGRFGKGTVVTGKTSLEDTPSRTTRYTFNVWYRGRAAGSPAEAAPALLHARYHIDIEVYDPRSAGMAEYRSPSGWLIRTLRQWRADPVPMPDPANNALVFFQKEEDSVERVAVAVVPVREASASALMDRVQQDMPSRYDGIQIHSRKDVTHEGVPAVLTVFSGGDNTHPGTRTTSLVLAFVREGRGYVISARTQASQFAARRPLLEKLVRSFTLTPARSTVSAR